MILHHSLAWWLVQLLRFAAAWMAAAVAYALLWISWPRLRCDRRPRRSAPRCMWAKYATATCTAKPNARGLWCYPCSTCPASGAKP